MTLRTGVAALILASAALAPREAASQSRGRPPDQWSFAVGAAFSGTLMEDGNGAVVRSGVAPALSVGAEWRAGTRLRLGAAVRGSGGEIDVEDDGQRWSAGSFTRLELLAVASADIGRFTARVGAGPVWMRGPADILPFRGEGDGFAMHWGGDASVDFAVDAARRYRLRVGLDAVGLSPGGATPAPEPGSFTRVHIGVAYVR